jgi:hypothetical protein
MAHDLIFGRTKRDWSCGSLLLPEKQQKVFLNKIDDVRYDIRNAGSAAKIGLLTLSAAIALVAVSSMFRIATTSKR